MTHSVTRLQRTLLRVVLRTGTAFAADFAAVAADWAAHLNPLLGDFLLDWGGTYVLTPRGQQTAI